MFAQDDLFVPGQRIGGRGDEEPWAFVALSRAHNAFGGDKQHPKYLQYRAWAETSEEVCDAVRVCDSANRQDTVILAHELVTSLPSLRRLMERASCGQFLSAPCSRRDACSTDLQADPAWFKALGIHPLGTAVAAKLEMAIWKVRWPRREVLVVWLCSCGYGCGCSCGCVWRWWRLLAGTVAYTVVGASRLGTKPTRSSGGDPRCSWAVDGAWR